MKLSICFMAVIAVLATSCGRGGEAKEQMADSASIATVTIEEPAAHTILSAADTTAATALQAGTPAVADWDKKLIKTANITLQLNNYDSFDNALHRQVRTFGAYIAAEKQTGSEHNIENEVTIKVPVYQFESLLNSLNGKDIVVKEKEITTSDVTAEVVDTKARMEAKKLVRERYMELMGEAQKMKDVLTVQQELNNLQENIEATQGRVNYLEHEAAYSTIHIRYYRFPVAPEDTTTPAGNYLGALVRSFGEGATIVGNIVLFLVAIWPVTVLTAIGWVMYKKKWSGRKGDKSV